MIKIFYCFEGGKRNDKQFLLLINGSAKKFGDEKQMLNREKNVQECDARKLNSSNEVWLQKNY